MEQFSDFAHIYDKLNVNYNKDEIVERLSGLFSGERKIADVCCGTGDVAIGLSKKGFRVSGIDISEEMLTVASGKAAEQGQRIFFVAEDVKSMKLPEKQDAISSVCDGMNYMMGQAELKEAFSSVNNALKCGGLFVFDVSTEYKFKNLLADKTFTFDFDDCFLSWSNDYNAKTSVCTMSLTGFEKCGNNKYSRFDEVHKQYCHKRKDVEACLDETGFDVINVFSGYSDKDATENDERILFVTRKKG